MVEKQLPLSTEKIPSILAPLLEKKGIHNSQIILYGSYAQRKQREGSDIDLIIVSRVFREKSIFERVDMATGIGRLLVKQFKKPFDLLFYSDTEWAQAQSPIIAAAKQKGMVL